MSARKRFILFALSVCLITMLTSCKHGVSQDFNFVAGDTYIALTDDSYIFMIMNGGKTTYYRQYLYEDTVKELGVIENFVLSTKGSAKVGQSIYFTVVINGGTSEYVGLYEIDLEENTLSEVARDNQCSYDAYTFSYGECVAIAKNIYGEDKVQTYIDVYDPQDNKLFTILNKEMNNESLEGAIILRACSDGDNLFTLMDIGTGGGSTPETSIVVCGQDGQSRAVKQEKKISLGSLEDYIMQARVFQMIVLNEYIYMSNYSNLSFFGKIDDDTISPIIEKHNLEFAGGGDKIVLYERGSNNIIIVNPRTGEYSDKTIAGKNNYSIKCILANETDALIVLKSAGKKDYVYRQLISELVG